MTASVLEPLYLGLPPVGAPTRVLQKNSEDNIQLCLDDGRGSCGYCRSIVLKRS